MLNLLNFRFLIVYMHVLLLLEKKKERELTELVRVKGISSSKTFSLQIYVFSCMGWLFLIRYIKIGYNFFAGICYSHVVGFSENVSDHAYSTINIFRT